MIPLSTAEALAREVVTWRAEARAAFASCRDADAVRRAFGRLWHRAEVASPDELAAISDEFQAALRRFIEEV